MYEYLIFQGSLVGVVTLVAAWCWLIARFGAREAQGEDETPLQAREAQGEDETPLQAGDVLAFKPNEGWGWPEFTRKPHYFRDGWSLCCRWLYDGELGAAVVWDRCKLCDKRFQKIAAERERATVVQIRQGESPSSN